MGTTTNFGWNYGTRRQNPWWDIWTALWQAVDTVLYPVKKKTDTWIDVIRDYGAVGDGITDDATAIQAAINACPVNGVVFFPSGKKYLFGNKLTIPSPITLQGGGFIYNDETQLLKKSTLNDTGILITGLGTKISDLYILGQNGNGGNGIDIKALSVSLLNVYVRNMGADGIRIGTAGADLCSLWNLNRVYCVNNLGNGLYIHSDSTNANAGVAIGYSASSNGLDGLRVGKSYNNVFISPYAEVNSGYGINMLSTSINNLILGGDQWESNTLGQIKDDGIGNTFIGTLNTTPITGSGTGRINLSTSGADGPKLNSLHVNNDGNPVWISIGATRTTDMLRMGFNPTSHIAEFKAINQAGDGYTLATIDASVLYINLTSGGQTRISGPFALVDLPSSNPGAGSKQVWYDPADGNKVKYSP